MRDYRVSALAYAAARMWRAWTVIIPVVVINAGVQALLVWPDVAVDAWIAILALAIASAITFMAAYGCVAASALRVSDGTVRWPAVVAVTRVHGLRYARWALGLLVVVVVGLALFAVPGVVALAVTPFVLIAAIDGARNPLAANFRIIRRRFWRWLVTALATGVLIVVGSLLVGLTNFFVRGAAASFISWLVAGLALAWFTVAWALIYRGGASQRAEFAGP